MPPANLTGATASSLAQTKSLISVHVYADVLSFTYFQDREREGAGKNERHKRWELFMQMYFLRQESNSNNANRSSLTTTSNDADMRYHFHKATIPLRRPRC